MKARVAALTGAGRTAERGSADYLSAQAPGHAAAELAGGAALAPRPRAIVQPALTGTFAFGDVARRAARADDSRTAVACFASRAWGGSTGIQADREPCFAARPRLYVRVQNEFGARQVPRIWRSFVVLLSSRVLGLVILGHGNSIIEIVTRIFSLGSGSSGLQFLTHALG